MEERMRFVDEVVDNEESFAAICRRFGVSRKTVIRRAKLTP
jgi:transposase-like protein